MYSLELICTTSSELRSSLNELSELAHASTRRLDNIYYNLLEKVGTIRATIGSLQELAEASRKLHSNFQEEVGGLETDIQSQIDAYGSFKEQQSRVEDMEARVRAARSRAEALSGRLETARTRVETWAHREKEWQEKTSSKFSATVLLYVCALTGCFRKIKIQPGSTDCIWCNHRCSSIHQTIETLFYPESTGRRCAQAATGKYIATSICCQ